MTYCGQHQLANRFLSFCLPRQAGDVGFDPLGISSLIDVRWLREAELKHGRVCMLAATGFIVQDVFKFPGVDKVFGKFDILVEPHVAFSLRILVKSLLLIIAVIAHITSIPTYPPRIQSCPPYTARETVTKSLTKPPLTPLVPEIEMLKV